ncbi:hypothetical protein SGLAM104S_10624 [Streptomyces glaucescens]
MRLAIFPYVIGVGAADSSYEVTEFAKKSSHGFADLVAPGEGIPAWCDAKFRSYCTAEGTSYATALVSAAAALIWSAHPDWTVNQVTRALLDTASRGWPKDEPSMYAGYGFIRPRVVLADPAAAGDDQPGASARCRRRKKGRRRGTNWKIRHARRLARRWAGPAAG